MRKIIRRHINANYYDEARTRRLSKEEKKQLSVVLQIQNKIMEIDMHNIEGKPKYSRTLGCLVAFKI